VRCPPLPVVEHSRSFYVEGDIGDEMADTGVPCDRVTDGNSCHYLCETGYRLTGPPVLTCNYSGHWDGDVPQCQSEYVLAALLLLSSMETSRHLSCAEKHCFRRQFVLLLVDVARSKITRRSDLYFIKIHLYQQPRM